MGLENRALRYTCWSMTDNGLRCEMSYFKRGLSKELTEALGKLASETGENWWKEVLDSKQLLLAIRGGYLNAYAQGQSVFKIGPGLDIGCKPAVLVHYKYLLEPSRPPGKEYIRFDGESFQVDPHEVICTDFKPGRTLPRLIAAASRYASDEKNGVHVIARKNPTVVDLEIAFTQTGEAGEDERDRIDLAALHPHGDDKAKVVFYEAKRADDPRLHAGPNGEPEVVKQMKGYDKFLCAPANHLAQAYKDVCATLVRLCSRSSRSPDKIIEEVGGDPPTRTLSVDPVVRLLVFGFDEDQKKGNIFMGHIEALKDRLAGRLVAKGNAGSFNLLKDYVRFPPSAAGA
jgi:hypothetical protein